MLTLQDVLFALGFAITAIFTWLTYRSSAHQKALQRVAGFSDSFSKVAGHNDNDNPAKAGPLMSNF